MMGLDFAITHSIDGVHDVPLGARALDRCHQQHNQHDAEEGAVRGRELVEIESVRVRRVDVALRRGDGAAAQTSDIVWSTIYSAQRQSGRALYNISSWQRSHKSNEKKFDIHAAAS